MKHLSAIIIFLLFYTVSSASVYDQLSAVNSIWKEKDQQTFQFPVITTLTDIEWIQLHLALVEQSLRANNITKLSDEQKKNRISALNYLHQYWQTGKFPQNTEYPYRTPIFIDKFDNFCAVGYLVKATGYESVSRTISSKTNLAYVREMNYPELNAWAKKFGFTIDELAWIQPTYPPQYALHNIGYGANGTVNELFVDDVSNALYVGGNFVAVDTGLIVNNIAYVTQTSSEYIWHNMGSGVNGTVNAICKYNNGIFAAGSFSNAGGVTVSNIAKWEGTNWSSAGCLNGIINDLIVYNNQLYALGNFSICSGAVNVNFAKWNGIDWVKIDGLDGTINTAEIIGTDLFLGGLFSYNSNSTNVIKWNASGFHLFDNNIVNEVKDFEFYDTTVYVGCKLTSLADTNLLLHLSNNEWDPVLNMNYFFTANQLSVNTLCASDNILLAAGDFIKYGMVANQNCMSVNYTSGGYWFNTDSVVNKMVSFNGKLIAGGSFNHGIGRKGDIYTLGAYIATQPACDSNGSIVANGAWGVPPYRYKWSTSDTSSSLFNLLPGNYQLEIRDCDYNIFSQSIVITGANKIDSIEYDNTSPYKFLIVHGPAPGAIYSMVNCADYSTITIQNNQPIFNVNRDGDYAFIVDQNGCIDTSDCIHIKIFPQNIVAISGTDGVSIYPNPLKDVLHIKTEMNIENIKIADVAGRIVFTKKVDAIKDIQLNVTAFSSGYYTLIMTSTDGNSTQYKLIKE